MEMPEKIKIWREKIWHLIGDNILQQVASFIELSHALTTLSQKVKGIQTTLDLKEGRSNRLINQINTLLRGSADDSMRQFLYSVVEYISRLPEDQTLLPIDTLRVLHDVERIIKIDKQLLSKNEQSKLRFYILQIARLVGDNG
jgi:hypothetical protein